jgi:hypothetical protein
MEIEASGLKRTTKRGFDNERPGDTWDIFYRPFNILP